MKLRMHENSLFAVLLRSPWWISIVIALALAAGMRLLIPTVYAVCSALPFFVIGLIAAYRQLRAPSAERVDAILAVVRGMAWREFADALEAGFKRDGYTVKRLDGGAADFELTKAHRRSLVTARKWKIARAGTDPLRELHDERQSAGAQESIYVAAGDVTDNARKFAAEKSIRIVSGAALVKWLPTVRPAGKP